MLYFQLVIMAGTVLLAYYFECTDTFQVHIQGFFCQDGDLMKPYPGTEEESFITPLVLYCVLAATPTAIIFIGEISMYFIKSTRESLIAQEKTNNGNICTGDLDVIEKARRSFPSKHAALSIYSALYATGMCVVHNFKGTQGSPSKPKSEDPHGVPLMAFPRIESPLETLSAQNHSASMTEVT
ncbi:phospholipid phosphatase related 1 [Rhinolophus ferrumequinum]|uniref:Phospholipid phosphatase related 1 n=1 Tax=Rhinolophus ferrumequinum TaxID=59479 RepID=A0A7J7VRZ5_RHIFE|nr:phospholipid phosphatase related 1 [Rhinolophus ferrumequinum]